MFEGFDVAMIETGEATIRVRHGGSGSSLLLRRVGLNLLHVSSVANISE